jgi:hypothetical protein
MYAIHAQPRRALVAALVALGLAVSLVAIPSRLGDATAGFGDTGHSGPPSITTTAPAPAAQTAPRWLDEPLRSPLIELAGPITPRVR